MIETPKILIIEDNPRNMKLMKIMLQSKGYTIAEAGDGETGLEHMAAEAVDLVVLDIQLPGISGLDVARTARTLEAARATPILAVTAFAQTADRDAALSAGCTAYMTKPVEMQAFLSEVDRLLNAAAASEAA